MATRLPVPGSDDGSWGDVLNNFLEVSHNTDGSLASGVVGSAQIQAGAVAASDVGLGNVDNTADSDKPVSNFVQTALDLKADDSAVMHVSGNESLAGTKTFNDPIIVHDYATFGNGPGASIQQPFQSVQQVDASAPGTHDKIGHVINTQMTGNFGAAAGTTDPSYAWGINAFTTTGANAGDGAGGTLYSALIEFDVEAPSGTIAEVIGLQAETAFFGAAAGAHVGTSIGLAVEALHRKAGATGGTVDYTYGIYVSDPTSIGATTATYGLWVDGGSTYLGGHLHVQGTFGIAVPLNFPLYTTSARPAASSAGMQGAGYYDTTLSKPVWSDGTNWRDAMGNLV
jgi:hypothetical protein